jgi:hypothetical protein
MKIDIKILEELKRFNEINRYTLNEQDAATPPADEAAPPTDAAAGPPADATAAAGGGAPPTEGGDTGGAEEVPEPIDVENDPDVEEVGKEAPEGGDDETEEIDITDLVTTQKDIKDKQDEFMDNIFAKLDDLENKLQHMDQIMKKIDSLETKFDKYRDKTPEEKLMLRSLDSYPYNQKLTDFFDDKKQEMESTGKNEYVLTSDEVENFSPNEVKKTFNSYDIEEED